MERAEFVAGPVEQVARGGGGTCTSSLLLLSIMIATVSSPHVRTTSRRAVIEPCGPKGGPGRGYQENEHLGANPKLVAAGGRRVRDRADVPNLWPREAEESGTGRTLSGACVWDPPARPAPLARRRAPPGLPPPSTVHLITTFTQQWGLPSVSTTPTQLARTSPRIVARPCYALPRRSRRRRRHVTGGQPGPRWTPAQLQRKGCLKNIAKSLRSRQRS